MINATITRDDPTCKLLNPPSFPLSRAVGEDYRGGRTVRAVWNLRGLLLLPRKNGRKRGGGRKRETYTHPRKHTHTYTRTFCHRHGRRVYNIWHSNVRERSPPSMISTVFAASYYELDWAKLYDYRASVIAFVRRGRWKSRGLKSYATLRGCYWSIELPWTESMKMSLIKLHRRSESVSLIYSQNTLLFRINMIWWQ